MNTHRRYLLLVVTHAILSFKGWLNMRLKLFMAVLVLVSGVVTFMAACGSDGGNGGTGCTGDACDGGALQDATTGLDGANVGDGGTVDGRVTDGAKPSDSGGGEGGDAAVVCNGPAGVLDTTFGDGGMVWLEYNAAQVSGVAVQVDEKIVVVGATQAGFAVVRLLPNGALDTTFGTNGLVTTLIGTTGFYSAVTLQNDGKILAAGGAEFATGKRSYDFAVARYFTDGGLDQGFGDGGVSTTDFGSANFTDDYPQSLAVLPDGRILLGGYSTVNGVQSTTNYSLARYNADGTPDATFGTGGKVSIDVHGTADTPGVAALLAGGKMVVAGVSAQTTSNSAANDISAVQLTVNGTLDTSFADAGVFTASVNPSSNYPVIASLAVDPLGRAVLAGHSTTGGPNDFNLFRLTANGAVDQTFADAGLATTDFSSRADQCASVVLQGDGKLVAGGTSGIGAISDTYGNALARYQPNGALDLTFGTAGRVLTAPPPNTKLGISGMVLDGCSIIAVGGIADFAANTSAIGIYRYKR
jgi:uncharacterized delta-60 repeat protein